jgi:hypothetical protein
MKGSFPVGSRPHGLLNRLAIWYTFGESVANLVVSLTIPLAIVAPSRNI